MYEQSLCKVLNINLLSPSQQFFSHVGILGQTSTKQWISCLAQEQNKVNAHSCKFLYVLNMQINLVILCKTAHTNVAFTYDKILPVLSQKHKSGIDTIKFHTWPSTPYGKMTKTQENSTYKRAKRSNLSQQVPTRLQETDKTLWQRQITKKVYKRSTNLERSVRKLLEGLNMFHGTNLTINSDVDQDT